MPYILITSDQSSINEKIVAAIDIVKFRLGEGQWPLYKATPFLYDLKKEDKCLVYLAGKNQFSQHFVGHFEILEVRQLLVINTIYIIFFLTLFQDQYKNLNHL